MEDRLRILLCEDDENLGMLLREYLQAKGFNADLFADGESGYKAFLKGKYDLCVLDVMMPKKDGFALAQEIRTVNSEVPVIFLTAKSLKEDILEGFKIGADDYITKPFSMEELVFRIEAILRRVKGKKGKEITIYFRDKDIDNMYNKGNAETIYWLRDDNGSLIGINISQSDEMDIKIKDREMSKIKHYNNINPRF